MKLTIMVFNMQHGLDFQKGDRIDLGLTADLIASCDADIVGLNEVRGDGVHPDYTDQAKFIADRLGYRYAFVPAIVFDKQGPYGNAVLSKKAPFSVTNIPIPDPSIKDEEAYYETRNIIRADFDFCTGFSFFVSHFGLAQSEKKLAVQTLVPHLDACDRPFVFAGDLNMTEDHPQMAPIKQRAYDTADQFEKPKFTFPSDKPDRKIDYIFTSFDIRVLSADILNVIVSDHLAHVAQIEL